MTFDSRVAVAAGITVADRASAPVVIRAVRAVSGPGPLASVPDGRADAGGGS